MCDKENKEITCFDCEGRGYTVPFLRSFEIPCSRCDSSGAIPAIQLEWKKLGETFRQRRIAQRELLRDASKRMNIDVMVLSRAEAGIIDPRTVFKD